VHILLAIYVTHLGSWFQLCQLRKVQWEVDSELSSLRRMSSGQLYSEDAAILMISNNGNHSRDYIKVTSQKTPGFQQQSLRSHGDMFYCLTCSKLCDLPGDFCFKIVPVSVKWKNPRQGVLSIVAFCFCSNTSETCNWATPKGRLAFKLETVCW
jgi:hypothetical protein